MNLNIDLAQFKEAMGEKVAQMREAARPSAQAGAQVIYDQARANAPISEHAHFFYSRRRKDGIAGTKYLFYPGGLKKALYQVYSKRNSGDGVSVYHISYNSQKAPYAHMVEFGTVKMSANPFLGNALAQKGQDAIDAIENRFIEEAGL